MIQIQQKEGGSLYFLLFIDRPQGALSAAYGFTEAVTLTLALLSLLSRWRPPEAEVSTTSLLS
jgi:hypothetical protein